MKTLPGLTLVLTLPLLAQAQHFVTAGAGFGVIVMNSEELDRFAKTYNSVNYPGLRAFLKGFDAGVGLQVEAGYRQVGRFSKAVKAGWQSYNSRDVAEFGNDEIRNLELRLNSLQVSGELGHGWRDFFVNGMATVHVSRKARIISELANADTVRSALSGTYKSAAAMALDAGITLGLYRDPVFLIAKISYPVYTGGRSEKLEDRTPAKIADGLSLFPDDYINFLERQPYDGVASAIDGLKIAVTIAFAFRL